MFVKKITPSNLGNFDQLFRGIIREKKGEIESFDQLLNNIIKGKKSFYFKDVDLSSKRDKWRNLKDKAVSEGKYELASKYREKEVMVCSKIIKLFLKEMKENKILIEISLEDDHPPDDLLLGKDSPLHKFIDKGKK